MDKHTNVIPGDKAVVVKSTDSRNLGAIVEVVRPYAPGEVLPEHRHPYATKLGDVDWVVESLGRKLFKELALSKEVFEYQVAMFPDACLRPLHNSDGEDQVVSRVGRAPVSTHNHEQRRRQPEKTT